MAKELASLTGPLNKEATQLVIQSLLSFMHDLLELMEPNLNDLLISTQAIKDLVDAETQVDPLVEKQLLNKLARLSFDATSQLRVVIPAITGTLTSLTTVTTVTQTGLGSFNLNGTNMLLTQQNYYNSFRRNITP